MGGFADFLNETLSPEEGKKSAFLGFLDTFTKDEQTKKSEQKPPKTGFTSFLEETLPPDPGATNEAVGKNIETIPPPQTEEYVDYTQAPPKEKPPWYDDYLGLIRPLLAGAQTGAAGITKALLKAADFISDKLGIPKSNAARIVADDLEKFSQANKARGVGGIVGDVASGIGRAAIDIPAIMSLGPAGLPVYGGLMGAAEGGLPGAIVGATSGALTHGALKGIGGLATPARVGAGAAFGAATTPGGLEERVKGAATMGVLSATGGKPRPGVIDLRGKVPEKAPEMTVAGQTTLPPPPTEAPTARIVPEATTPRIKPSSISTAYLNEQINYGGELRARGSVIAEMQSQGVPQQRIGAYMMGAKTVQTAAELPSPATEAVGRVTKTTVPATEAPVGPELPPGLPPSPSNPIQDVSEMSQIKPLPARVGKRSLTPMIQMFKKTPFFMKRLYVPKMEADAATVKENTVVHKDRVRMEKLVGKEGESRIYAYAISKMPGGGEALAATGITDIPTTLRPVEMEVYNHIVNDQLPQMHPRINQARGTLGLADIGHIPNYFTFLRDRGAIENGDFFVYAEDAGRIAHMLKKPTDPYFFKERTGGKGPLIPRLFDTYEMYMNKAAAYVNNAPVVAESRKLLGDISYADPQGQKQTFKYSVHDPTRAEALERWVDFSAVNLSPHSVLAGTIGPEAARTMQVINKNAAAATLSLNVRPMLLQWASLRNSYMELGPKWLTRGVLASLHPSARKPIWEKSNTLAGRAFDVTVSALRDKMPARPESTTAIKKMAQTLGRGAEVVGKPTQAVAKFGLEGLRLSDMEVYRWTITGAYLEGVTPKNRGGLGLSEVEAMRRADILATETQGSAARRDISPFQRTIEGKLASMFQTFTINEFGYLNSRFFGKKEEGFTREQRLRAIYRYALATVVVNVLFEDVLNMRSPFPTPERELVAVLRGKKNWREGLVAAGKEMLEPVPLVGSMWRWGTERKTMLPFALQNVVDIMQNTQKAGRAFTSGDWGNMEVGDVAPFAQLAGIPGTSEAMKTMRRREQGGTWFQSIMGQKMESLGTAPAGLSKADKELLKKYGVGPGAGKAAPKKNQKAIDDLLKKYGVKK